MTPNIDNHKNNISKPKDKIYRKFREKGIPVTKDISKGEFKNYLQKIERDRSGIKKVLYVPEMFISGFKKVIDSGKETNKQRLEAYKKAMNSCQQMIDLTKSELKQKLSSQQRERNYDRLDNLLISVNDLYKKLDRGHIEIFNDAVNKVILIGSIITIVEVLRRWFNKDNTT